MRGRLTRPCAWKQVSRVKAGGGQISSWWVSLTKQRHEQYRGKYIFAQSSRDGSAQHRGGGHARSVWRAAQLAGAFCQWPASKAEASFNAVQTLREIWWRLSLWACRKLSYARAGRRALN